MKATKMIVIITALLAAPLAALAQDDTSDAASAPVKALAGPVTPALSDTNAAAESYPTNGLILNFHDVPLNAVLNYLSVKAGLIVVSDANLQGTVTLVAKQPVSTNEIVELLNGQLAKNNLGAILQGRTLTIMDNERIKSLAGTPVKLLTNGANSLLNGDQIVTAIMPVNTLNPSQLVKDLEKLIPSNASVTANDAGSAVLMTAPGKDIHRISEIIYALDSSSVSDVEVFSLKYADAKSVASELKEVFQSADSDVTRATSRNNFGRGRGGGPGGGFPFMGGGGGGGGGNNNEDSKNAQTHAVFTSDDQMNAVVASAPPSYMPWVSNVIFELDKESQDITEIKVVKLRHADPVEIAAELADLFPSTTSNDQNNRNMGFRFAPPWMQQNNGNNNQSQRMKQQQTVLAVADRRTESVVVTASVSMMEQITNMIAALDQGTAGMTHVTAIHLDSADPSSVEQTMAGLFPNTGAASSTTTTTALSARATGNNNSMSSSTTSSTSGFGSSGTGASAIH
jgi:type II secretory pathway component GspD/PulD (secretin)